MCQKKNMFQPRPPPLSPNNEQQGNISSPPPVHQIPIYALASFKRILHKGAFLTSIRILFVTNGVKNIRQWTGHYTSNIRTNIYYIEVLNGRLAFSESIDSLRDTHQ